MASAKDGHRADKALKNEYMESVSWPPTPLSSARSSEDATHNWPGWPADNDLMQMDLPQFPAHAKAQCVAHSVPGSTATSRSSSLGSHRGEGSVSPSEGQKRKHTEPPPLSREDLVSTM
eukprot:5384390-Karenia_brevis.AAC.1